MLDELLITGKITRHEYVTYLLFECNELGREFYSNMLMNTFMDEPKSMDDGGIKLAFLDGKRGVFREIHLALLFVKQKLQEVDNDNGKSR